MYQYFGRADHTATLLPDGQVLVTAGHNDTSSYLADAMLYEPRWEMWGTVASLHTSRANHTATLLPNGKVLLAGGRNDSGSLASAELYDPATLGWSTTNFLANARYSHTATLLPNGLVLAVGGFSPVPASAELFGVFHTITASAGTGGVISPSGTMLLEDGFDCAYTFSPAAGYYAVDVLVDGVPVGARSSYTFTNVTADHAIAVSFSNETHTITATAGPNGSISPAGTVTLNLGAEQTFTIIPAAGYYVGDVVVDGSSVGVRTSYTFTNITTDHTIAVSFVPWPWRLIDLGSLGGPSSSASGINNRGQIVGYSSTADGLVHAFLHAGGAMTDLGTMGGNYSSAYGINNSGQVVGYSTPPAGMYGHANLWSGVAITDLGTLGGRESLAFAINGSGQVAGYSLTTDQLQHAFLYSDGVMTDLGTFEGAITSIARGINDSGWVVGECSFINGYDVWERAFLYSNGVMTDLGSLGGRDSVALCINHSGQVAGGSSTANGQFHAFLWSQGIMTDLGTLGGSLSIAHGINDSGQVVGTSTTVNNERHAFLWADGVMTDLGTMGQDFVDNKACGINSYGQVVGYSMTTAGTTRAFLYNPSVANHTITTAAGAHGSITPDGVLTVKNGADQSFTITPDSGYHVVDVVVDGASVGAVTIYTFSNVTVDHTIAASFAIGANTNIITATAGANGSISPSGLVPVNYGGNQTFIITPNHGYHVAGVLVDGVSQTVAPSYTFSNVITNHSIVVTFAIDTFTINASAGANGNITPAGTVSVNYGSNQSFTITPNTGYHVAGVLVDGVSQTVAPSYTFSNVTTNHTIVVTFAIDTFTINASAGANGSITPAGTVSVNYGSNQSFTITPNTGYHVAGVLVDGVSQTVAPSYTFSNVTTNHTIVVTFAIDTFTINASAGANGSITPAGTVSVNYGSNQSFTITPNTGYHVADVVVDGVSAGAVASYTFTDVTGNHTIAATFALGEGTWSPTGSLINYGEGHTATLLPNGKVLVVGGENRYGKFSSALNRAELYDPASGTWTATTNLTSARDNHTTTLLPNGRVLVAGGWNDDGASASAELYDPTTAIWTNTGSLTADRYYHSAALLSNGRVLVAGGYNNNGALASAELYDPATGTWSSAGSLKVGRGGHTATLLADGKILVAGGQHGSDYLSSAELYDPATDTWTATGNLNAGRIEHTATLLTNGKVLVSGGGNPSGPLSSTELYDPATGAWTATGALNAPRNIHTASLLPNGKVLAAGGGGVGGVLNSAELYDPSSGVWTTTGSLGTGRVYHSATLLSNGKVMAAGGLDPNGISSISAELYTDNVGTPHTISASSGEGGSVTPPGLTVVGDGNSVSFTITPAAGYHVADVLIDGVSMGARTSYIFSNVTADHTVAATFVPVPSHGIYAGAGPNGAISPSGLTPVNEGANQTFTITPDPGYHIADVMIYPGAISVGAVPSYTFTDVRLDNLAIYATFALDTHTINASAGPHGSISPAGAISVDYGSNLTFTITPDLGYHVADVLVDGASKGAVTSFDFVNVTVDHTISATFAINLVHSITAVAGPHGSISPSGVVSVNYGSNQAFTIIPAANYHVVDVLVDGASVGAVTSFTFTNVTADHTIAASFAITAPQIYTISATAGLHGSISPAGAVSVPEGGSQGFTIKPDTNYNVKTVLVDGLPVGPVSSYSFNNVTGNHTIAATFGATTVSILTDKDKVKVPPGKTAPLQVKLSDEPSTSVVVTVAWQSGSPALRIEGVATLTFTTANWDTYQTVQIAATPDKTDMNATAVFELSAPAQTGKQVTAIKGQTGGISPILYLLLESEDGESQNVLPLLENPQKPEPSITEPKISEADSPVAGPEIRKLDQ